MFKVSDTLATFHALSATPIQSLPLSQSFGLLIDFYETQRAADAAPLDGDGDMLLFQWGINKWADGSPFEVNLTRQIIYPDGEDQDIYHLALTYAYAMDASFEALGKGNSWVHNPAEAPQARAQILTADPVIRCAALDPSSVDLFWEQQ